MLGPDKGEKCWVRKVFPLQGLGRSPIIGSINDVAANGHAGEREMMFHGDQRSFAGEQERCLVTVVCAPGRVNFIDMLGQDGAQNIISSSPKTISFIS